MRMKIPKSLGYGKSSPRGEIHHNTSIPQKIEKNLNTQANLTPKVIGERAANKAYTKQKKRDNKDSNITQ